MLMSVHSGNRLRNWVLTGCCLAFTFLFWAVFNGELGFLTQIPDDYSFRVQDESSRSRHDLLEDVSNATLGV